jgi:hypothetical protein
MSGYILLKIDGHVVPIDQQFLDELLDDLNYNRKQNQCLTSQNKELTSKINELTSTLKELEKQYRVYMDDL